MATNHLKPFPQANGLIYSVLQSLFTRRISVPRLPSRVFTNRLRRTLTSFKFENKNREHNVRQLKMTDHVAALCRSCFFQLRQIRSIRRSLTSDARKTLVNAFVMSRLDYCNSLCQGINEGLWTSCSISRMRLLGLSRTHGNTIISLLFFEICTGSQFVKESSSSWRPWSTNVSTVCVFPILQRTAYCCLPLVVGSTCDRLADWNCLFQEHELWHLARGLSRWQARGFGILCPLL